MNAFSLFLLLFLGKAYLIWHQSIPITFLSPIAFFWQDIFFVSCYYLLIDKAFKNTKINFIVYCIFFLYLALNLVFMAVLSSPFTFNMIKAADFALYDSVIEYFDQRTLIIFLIAVFVIFIRIQLAKISWPQTKQIFNIGLFGIITLMIFGGPIATRNTETLNLHLTPLASLFSFDLMKAKTSVIRPRRWRQSISKPIQFTRNDILEKFEGVAKNMNIVLISLESTGARYLKPFDGRNDPMPYLTELTKNALIFKNAYSSYPESIKGLFSTLCSLYPVVNTRPLMYEKVKCQSLAHILGALDYQSLMFHSGYFYYLGMSSIIKNLGYQKYVDAAQMDIEEKSSFGIDNEMFGINYILKWLDENKKKGNFFITYLPISGHHPYQGPPPYPFGNKTLKDNYLNSLYHTDRAIELLIEGLKKRSLYKNTLFIFYGDHGQAFFQHPGNMGHNLYLYEENLKVPLIFHSSKIFKSSYNIKKNVGLIDLMPTVLRLMSLDIPPYYQGYSLLKSGKLMALFFTDYSGEKVGLRDIDWKFIYEVDTKRQYLFELKNDPNEKMNLSDENPDLVQKYKKHLIDWIRYQKNYVNALQN